MATLAVLLLGVTRLGAQAPADPAGLLHPLVTIGSLADEHLRLRQLVGEADPRGYLIRSPSTLIAPLAGRDDVLRWALVVPELRTAWNSALPYSLNDGSMWAGRGVSAHLMAGIRLEYGPVGLTLAPHFTWSANRDFQTIPSTTPHRSPMQPPWYTGTQSADLPYRPGDLPFRQVDLGQSTLSLRLGPATIGATTEHAWWGPGIRNALVLSNNAPGIPRLFLRTGRPLQTHVGEFEAEWFAGGLTKSLFFDAQEDDDLRSLSALAATFRPRWEPDLILGVARSVYAPVASASRVPGRWFDVLAHWHPEGSATDGAPREQLLSLFGRWIFPADGFEAYAEWARVSLPHSWSDFVSAPNHTQGYTLGVQWARPVHVERGWRARLQSELTYLEQSATFRVREAPLFYVSQRIPQGYTHRGKVIGAAIGPGASSQWLAADFLAPTWQIGIFGGRIRWDNDAYYRQPTGRSEVAHDVQLLHGVRTAASLPWFALSAELTRSQRLNYLYQNLLRGFSAEGAVDLSNTTVRITVSPRSR